MNTESSLSVSDGSETFSMTFDGNSQMDAGLVGTILANTAYIVDRTANQDPNRPRVKLQVKTFQKGSFSIILNVVVETAPQVSVFDFVQCAVNITGIVVGVFQIKEFLKGRKPKIVEKDADSNTARITSEDGREIDVPAESSAVLDEPKLDQKVSEIAAAARLHNPDGGIRFSSESISHTFDRDAVCDIALPIDGLSKSSYERRFKARIALLIHKPDLLGNSSWGFKSDLGTISAKIEDEDFLEAVHKGLMAYKAGDRLDVELLTIEQYSSNDVLVKTSRIIEKVYGVVPDHAEQTSIDLDPSSSH